MLPVQDVIPSRTTPWTTITLVATLAFVLIVEHLLPDATLRTLILSYGLSPAHVTWLSIVTSLFLHYGLFDGVANLFALWLFGDNLEDRLGHGRFLAFFLLSGVMSNLAVVWLDPAAEAALVGAGGAVGGVVGAYLALLPGARILVLVPVWRGVDLLEIPAMIVPAFWLLLVAVGASAHPGSTTGLPLTLVAQLAGFVTGLVTARLFARRQRQRCEWWNVPSGQLPPDFRRTSRDTSASSVSSASN